MKIAVATTEDGKLFKGHFGSAPNYFIYNERGEFIEKIENPHDPKKTKVHHDNPKLIKDLLSDVEVFIGKRFGEQSKQKLVTKLNIKAFGTTKNLPEEAVKEFLESDE